MRKICFLIGILVWGTIQTAKAADENIVLLMNAVNEQHLTPLDLPKLTMAAFEGLHNMDPKIRVANDKSRFTFYYDAKVYKNFNKPETDEIADWAELIDKVFKAAVQISPQISLKDFEAPDAMMSQMVATLDKDSKFYTAMEMADKSNLKRKVNFASRLIGDILYIRIGVFDVNTYQKMAELLRENKNAQALILDLRGNSGGQLLSASKVAGAFLEAGIVFMTKGKSKYSSMVYQASAKDEFEDKPVAVLVDANTASAAELVAGSLQEQSRAMIVGTETFGKGTTQNLQLLPNGSILAITNAAIYLPSGTSFTNRGVLPDYCVSNKTHSPENCERQDRMNNEEDVETAVMLLKSRI